jgi:hypothetical protein
MYLYNACKIYIFFVSVLKRTVVESVLITRIDVAQNSSYFPGLKQCKQKLENIKPKNVKPDLCPHPQSFFWSNTVFISWQDLSWSSLLCLGGSLTSPASVVLMCQTALSFSSFCVLDFIGKIKMKVWILTWTFLGLSLLVGVKGRKLKSTNIQIRQKPYSSQHNKFWLG